MIFLLFIYLIIYLFIYLFINHFPSQVCSWLKTSKFFHIKQTKQRCFLFFYSIWNYNQVNCYFISENIK